MTPPVPRSTHGRLLRVLDHIERNLDRRLTLAVLSRAAALSPQHFHRRFAARFGIPVQRHVRLLRLQRASFQLAFRPWLPVTRVALQAGYDAPDAFARAFRRASGQSPSGFRRAPDWARWRLAALPIAAIRRCRMSTPSAGQVRILEFPETRIAMLRHQGDPAALGGTIRQFIAWRRGAGLPPGRSATFNILHGDPATTPPDRFRLDLCAAAPGVAPNDAGIRAGVIPALRCACLRHEGPEETLGASIDWLCRAWLPESGEAMADHPVFLQRLRFFPDVPAAEAATDIFLPLRPRPPRPDWA